MADAMGLLYDTPYAKGLLATKDVPQGLLAFGNININKRPKVANKDGSFSTVESMSVNHDGVEWLIPTIREDGRRMTPDEAYKHFMKTGRHLGSFVTPQFADVYAKILSERQGAFYNAPKD